MTQPNHLLIQLEAKSLYLNENCPVRKTKFQPGDKVVLCQKNNTPVSLTAWYEMLPSWGGRCPYCGSQATIVEEPKRKRSWVVLTAISILVAILVWFALKNRVIQDQIISSPSGSAQTTPANLPIRPTPISAIETNPAPPIISTASESDTLPGSIPMSTPDPVKPEISGTSLAEGLNVRQGPGVRYKILTSLSRGDHITIFRRNPEGNWLEVETPAQIIGWVSAKYVEILGDKESIEVAANLEPTPTVPIDQLSADLLSLDLDGASIPETLAPNQEHWYAFVSNERDAIIFFMFKPNVDLSADKMQFFLYDQHQIPFWPPANPDQLNNIGAGSHLASDRDGDLGTGELLWRGPLEREVRYYLRLVNSSQSIVQYCLAPKDEYVWSCP